MLVCLARDGCLVRSLGGGSAAGWRGATGREQERSGVLGEASKAIPHNAARVVDGIAFEADFLFLPLKKQVKIYINSIKNKASKSILK